MKGGHMGAKTTREIAEWICRSGYEDFSREMVDYAKLMALSHLGMTVADSAMPFGKIAIQYVKEQNCPANRGRRPFNRGGIRGQKRHLRRHARKTRLYRESHHSRGPGRFYGSLDRSTRF